MSSPLWLPAIGQAITAFTSEVLNYLNKSKELSIEEKRLDNEYRLAKQDRENELRRIKLQRDGVIKALREQRNVIKAAFAPDMKVLDSIQKDKDIFLKQSKKITDKIIHSNIPLEEKKDLRESLEMIYREIHKCQELQLSIIDKNKETLTSISNKFMNIRDMTTKG